MDVVRIGLALLWQLCRRSLKLIPVVIRRLGLIAILALWQGDSTSLQAQEIQVGVDFLTVVPQGDFKKNIANNGYGLGGHFLVRLKQSPVSVGADVGVVTYGSEKRKEPFSGTIPEITVEVETDNNIALTHFLVRAQPRRGSVRPYVDGLIGFKYLYTRTRIRDDLGGEAIASRTNFSDLTFSYGFGGGVQVRLAEFRRRQQILLDSNVRYLRGSEAEYLRKGSIRRGDGGVLFDVLSSRTDVLAVQIGVTFRF